MYSGGESVNLSPFHPRAVLAALDRCERRPGVLTRIWRYFTEMPHG